MATYRELQEQAQKLLEQAEQQRQQELTEALESISKTVSELGISLEELFDYLKGAGFKAARGSRKAKAVKPEAKYRNPATGATWSGRGRAPAWLREAEEKGKGREKFLAK